MLEYLVLTLSLLASGHTGTGTIFGSSKWDRTNPNSHLACYRRDISDRDMVVAHNTLPCGTRVWLFNPRTGRSTVAVVGDRGPRYAMVDLSKAVASRLSHNGREPVLLVPLMHRSLIDRDLQRSLVEGDPDRPVAPAAEARLAAPAADPSPTSTPAGDD